MTAGLECPFQQSVAHIVGHGSQPDLTFMVAASYVGSVLRSVMTERSYLRWPVAGCLASSSAR